MFTGIVEATGKVEIAAPFSQELAPGASLAVNGCCLTVTEIVQSRLQFDVLGETLRRTNLGDLRPGDLVNLERPMAADGRFDGHLVQGHIDTPAAVLTLEEKGSDRRIEIELPSSFQQYVVFKGSVAIDGISLTIAELHPSSFVLWIIPHTWEITNLHRLAPGALVNLEFDLIAKYVERMWSTHNGSLMANAGGRSQKSPE